MSCSTRSSANSDLKKRMTLTTVQGGTASSRHLANYIPLPPLPSATLSSTGPSQPCLLGQTGEK